MILVQGEHPDAVHDAEPLRCWRVVCHPPAVPAHAAEDLGPEEVHAVGGRRADGAKRPEITEAAELHVLPVEEEAMVGIEPGFPHTERHVWTSAAGAAAPPTASPRRASRGS